MTPPAVTFFAYDPIGKISLFVLDWDAVQIEGAMLETRRLRSSLASKNSLNYVMPAAARLAPSLRTRTRARFSSNKHYAGKCPRRQSTRS
jgi:hypothetical protein